MMDDALADEVLSDLVVKRTEGERYDSTGQSRRASRLSGAAIGSFSAGNFGETKASRSFPLQSETFVGSSAERRGASEMQSR